MRTACYNFLHEQGDLLDEMRDYRDMEISDILPILLHKPF